MVNMKKDYSMNHKQLQQNILRASKKVERMEHVVLGFNFIAEMGAIGIDLPRMSLYRGKRKVLDFR